MSRVAVANHAKLSWLLLRGAMRRIAGRANGHPLVRWPLTPLKADRLLIAPQDLRTADATRASEIYSGRFAFAGKVVVCDGRSIFEMEPPSDEWAAALLGFGWLRHLRAAESGITRANARALVDEWIALQGSWHPLGWRPDVLSRRIISWLSQSTLVLQDADVRFYRRFLRSLVRQVRYLRHTAGDARRGVARMQAAIALSYAALCIAGQARHIKSTTERLKHEIERQILPDGGHVSRDPGAIIEILLELLPLRQAFAARNIAPPQALLNAIDRMMPMLRFFRHSEGTFAHFNGMGATPADLLSTLLAYDETRGAPFVERALFGLPAARSRRRRAHHGYRPRAADRNESRRACRLPVVRILVAEAEPHRRQLRHAGDRARELAAAGARDRGAFDGHVQQHVLGALRRIGDVPARARRLADAGRPEQSCGDARGSVADAIVLRAAHDGYADRFGIVHERVLTLAADGTRLDGEDLFLAADGGSQLRTAARRIRRPLSSASHGESHPADRRPRRHADDAEQGSMDFQRPRGSRRARGQRLSRRQRRPAPDRADRHPRPCAHRLARAVELPAGQSVQRLPVPARRAAPREEEPRLPL